MPTYVYKNCGCPDQEAYGETIEFNVPIEFRDTVTCGFCEQPMERKIAFNGLTWAPTAGGMR